MRYLSLFAGIGGLEHPDTPPILACELDTACREVLGNRYPDTPIHDDIVTLEDPPKADFILGGWPCQDLSVAGKLRGIEASRSGLFFQMVEVAISAEAHTLIGENVPNLLRINGGNDFRIVLTTLTEKGFPFIGWRTLNARQFGLPQQRRRVLVVASKDETRASTFVNVPVPITQNEREDARLNDEDDAFGLYWTAGARSMCWSKGFVPALKVGASDGKGRSALAVFYKGQLRKLSPEECLLLQGFRTDDFGEISRTDAIRMAGNAVSKPVGHFAVEAACRNPFAIRNRHLGRSQIESSKFDEEGLCANGLVASWPAKKTPLCSNLVKFLDTSNRDSLSAQACAGLLVRCMRSRQPIDLRLFDVLFANSKDRTGPLRGSRTNSFEVLDRMEPMEYRSWLERHGTSHNQLTFQW